MNISHLTLDSCYPPVPFPGRKGGGGGGGGRRRRKRRREEGRGGEGTGGGEKRKRSHCNSGSIETRTREITSEHITETIKGRYSEDIIIEV